MSVLCVISVELNVSFCYEMALSLAYVNFFREARGRKVVNVEDIVDCNKPRFHDDFNDDKTYQVKWPHLPNDKSFSTEGTFDAKVLCLGGKFPNVSRLISEVKLCFDITRLYGGHLCYL